MKLKDLRIKIFADGAELKGMLEAYRQGLVRGFTTNPTLMRRAGVEDYEKFAREVIEAIPDLPLSFEVFTDDMASMEKEARRISSWGKNVYTKVPVTNTQGASCGPLIQRLSSQGVKLNVTAILDLAQVREVTGALTSGVPSIVSVFAGRVADTGLDAVSLMKEARELCRTLEGCELLWASVRELWNIYQAESIGCHIITVPNDILKKAALVGMDLRALSLDTVKMFHSDAVAAGYRIL
jgi:transaldolase